MCFSTWKTRIHSDMCSSTWKTHIPSDMCSPTWETNIPGDTCSPTWETDVPLPGKHIFLPGKHISLMIHIRLPHGKHICLVICVPLLGKHIFLVIWVPGQGNISLVMSVPQTPHLVGAPWRPCQLLSLILLGPVDRRPISA